MHLARTAEELSPDRFLKTLFCVSSLLHKTATFSVLRKPTRMPYVSFVSNFNNTFTAN
jgi:hypothetical protein